MKPDLELTVHALKKNKLANRIHVGRDGAETPAFIFVDDPPAAEPLETPKEVLLDLKLPKFDGLKVLRRLKADPRTRTIPVAGPTSSREDRDLEEAHKVGVNSCIVKPVEFESVSTPSGSSAWIG